MTRKNEILAFVEQANENIILELYNKAYKNLDELNAKVDKYSTYLSLIILLFFISANLEVDTLQIGPISIKNTSIITTIIPLLYFAFIFNILVMVMHKSELYFAVKLLGERIYKSDYKLSNLHDFQNNFINRISLPFSYSSFGREIVTKNDGILGLVFGIIVVLPSLLVIMAIFIIGFFMLTDLWNLYYNTLIGKISFWGCIWGILFIFFIIRNWSKFLNGEKLNI